MTSQVTCNINYSRWDPCGLTRMPVKFEIVWYVRTVAEVFERRIQSICEPAAAWCIVASSWRGGELILKHFVAVERLTKTN